MNATLMQLVDGMKEIVLTCVMKTVARGLTGRENKAVHNRATLPFVSALFSSCNENGCIERRTYVDYN